MDLPRPWPHAAGLSRRGNLFIKGLVAENRHLKGSFWIWARGCRPVMGFGGIGTFGTGRSERKKVKSHRRKKFVKLK